MLGAEILALVALIIVGGIGVKSVSASWRMAGERRSQQVRDRELMHADLLVALKDYTKADAFLAMWGDTAPRGLVEYVRARRDELYLGADFSGPGSKKDQ